ncbi:efflux RND transporter periplasmic adaptor subunit [Microbulbifer harenosus]|uniref:Efflux RND transporter periplasmic adaptor subunit n=1 Tax=Microbulbifer harenosus TaxID=2576840 RepID=A0ABY2UKW7_9GAMM|nr:MULTISPECIES: efflux RND transporter periplasmic adaptor subunit [Microbulbifer]QIL89391.1 efflux RND transporter periplasmic adaptor subunit [Microbulbifer sp. SH-1]TLM78691.1 efflux RND transporter periplasmic adaptor subunit [Microbulbifer harenosus]
MWSFKLLFTALLTFLAFTGAIVAYAAGDATAAAPMAVEGVIAKRQPLIEEVPVTGTINPLRQALLSAEVAGLIHEIHTDIGDRVQKGDLLLKLDPELSSINRDAALAEVARVRETVADSRRRLAELQRLLGDKHVAETEVESLGSEVRERSAQLQAAQVETERLSALLRRHRVDAPFSGIISLREVDVGEWVEPGTALFELVDTDSLRADFQVPQRYYPRIRPQTRIRVTLDNGQTLNTRVEHKIPVSRSGSRTFLLRTVIDAGSRNPPELIPGMSASAVLQLKSDREGIAVPRDAVLRYPDGRITVWVAAAGSDWGVPVNVREQQVTTGLSFNGMIEIRSGIEAGERVIVRGNESLQPGQQAVLKPAPIATSEADNR